jgi:hypothetical protein
VSASRESDDTDKTPERARAPGHFERRV